MKPWAWILILFGLPALGAALGAWAGPGLARTHPTVSLADRVHLEQTQGLTERTKASEAFRDNAGDAPELHVRGARIQRQFVWGTAILGVWIGLVVAAKLWAAAHPKPSAVAVVDHAHCVSCGRCFASCPRERLRWRGPDLGSEHP
jgi:ferredoxin